MDERKGTEKKKVLTALTLLLIMTLAALPFVLDKLQDAEGDGASILSATVTRADLSRTVAGAGTVGAKDAVSLSVPADVVLTGYAVSDGDFVRAGDPVAYVDGVSVYKLIASLGEELESVTESIAEVQNTWASSVISSNVAGTVTAVYAEDGDDIRSVMARHGALCEITLENGTVLKVSATSGTVLTVFVTEGDAVFVNASLFSVSDVETMGAYGALVLRHHKIEEQLAQLFQLYRDGYAAAPSDGMITGTDETLVKKLAFEEEDAGSLDFLVNARFADEPAGGGIRSLALGDTTTVTEYVTSTVIESPDSSGQGLVSNVYGTLDFSAFPAAKSGDTVFMQQDSTYVTGENGSEYLADVQYTILLVESGKSDSSDEDEDSNSKSSSGSKSGSGGSGSGGSGSGGTTSSATESTTSVSSVNLNTKAVASVVPMDEALVTISIDELDILSLHVGNEALVTIDALPGRSFAGVVTGVNTGRSNAGGNSKYTAEVTIPRSFDMLDGMNVSCLITIETLKNVLTIPSAALCDEGGMQIIYTTLSRDKSSLSDPVPVEVGFSDGETLEILSGLSEGDSVWYKTFDTPEYTVQKTRSTGSLNSFLGIRSSRR